MSWLSQAWNDITGKSAADANAVAQAQAQQQQQQQLNLQKQIAAQQAAEQQAQQQATSNNITQGKSAIDSAFAQFNDPYFANAAKSYSDYYLPQIDQQEGVARDKLTAQLAGQGTLSSSVGANALATLAKSAADQRANAANEAQGFANNLRLKVNSEKNQLYGTNTGAADPSQLATQATGAATALANPTNLTPAQPIGDLFAGLLQPAANAITANSNLLKSNNSTYGVSSYAPTSGAGSSRVIN